MARSRIIKPAFFANDQLAECEPLARLLFVGLWTLADREGRLEYRPRRIKAQVLPYDNCDVAALIEQLINVDVIHRYGLDGEYLSVVAFTEHQNPHQREVKSTLPGPGDAQPRYDQGTTKAVPRHRQDSLDPLTLNLDPELSYESSCASPDGAARPLATKHDLRFDDWWAVYPRKKAKPEARKAWIKHRCDAMADRLIADVEMRVARDAGWTEKKYTLYPASYLNGARWEDDVTPIASPASNHTSGTRSRSQPLLGVADRTAIANGVDPAHLTNSPAPEPEEPSALGALIEGESKAFTK